MPTGARMPFSNCAGSTNSALRCSTPASSGRRRLRWPKSSSSSTVPDDQQHSGGDLAALASVNSWKPNSDGTRLVSFVRTDA